jgi:hypothetical protein
MLEELGVEVLFLVGVPLLFFIVAVLFRCGAELWEWMQKVGRKIRRFANRSRVTEPEPAAGTEPTSAPAPASDSTPERPVQRAEDRAEGGEADFELDIVIEYEELGSSSAPGPEAGLAGTTSTPETGGPEPTEQGEGANLARLFAALAARADAGGEALEHLVAQEWRGKPVMGRGRVIHVSSVFGLDQDFDVTGGLRVTVEVPRDRSDGGWTVDFHCPDLGQDQRPGYGQMVSVTGIVMGYRAWSSTLYVGETILRSDAG